MVSELVFGAVLTLSATFVLVLSGVIAWLVAKVWKLDSQRVPQIESDVRSVTEDFRGPSDDSSGGHREMAHEEFERLHDRLDTLAVQIENVKTTNRDEHEELMSRVDDIVAVLKDEGFNGQLPD